jgi:hypothetical protein
MLKAVIATYLLRLVNHMLLVACFEVHNLFATCFGVLQSNFVFLGIFAKCKFPHGAFLG